MTAGAPALDAQGTPSAPFAGWVLTQTGRAPAALAWELRDPDGPDRALYLSRTWEAHRGRWRRRAGSAGVDTRALIGQQVVGRQARGADDSGRPRYAPDTDESRRAEIALIEAAFRAALQTE